MRALLSLVLLGFAGSVAVGCASSAPPPAVEPAPRVGPQATCGGASCADCVREAGCAFHRVSGMCLTPDQAEVCSGETCATAASECAAAR